LPGGENNFCAERWAGRHATQCRRSLATWCAADRFAALAPRRVTEKSFKERFCVVMKSRRAVRLLTASLRSLLVE